ncbi:MAG: cyclopropane-fatty-acyl-phospholipid synthase family protein [Pseudomonadota bacterium]
MSARLQEIDLSINGTLDAARAQAEAWRREIVASAEDLTPTNISKKLRGLPLKAKTALRASLSLPAGSLTVQTPEGRVLRIEGKAPGPDGVVVLKNWNLPKRALMHGTIGVGESYMDGDWDSPDVTSFLELFCVNVDVGEAVSKSSRIMRGVDRVRNWLNRNTRDQAKKNIAAHYDLGNAFYDKWLDSSMTYSSGVYTTETNDLASAQKAKYQKIAKATDITAEDHVLEIGCGWGGFAEYAASEIGCRVTCLTISKEQFAFAKKRIAAAGLDDRVKIKFQDYRDEAGKYDKVVSIEMFEAVGEEFWETYFCKLSDVLKPGGKAGVQVITICNNGYDVYRSQPDFIQRYIFPGGMLPSPKIMEELAKSGSLDVIDTFCFPQDYARTLAEWRERFWEAWDEIVPLGFDDRFKRMWEFYLYYCEAGFRSEFIDVRQITYQKPA